MTYHTKYFYVERLDRKVSSSGLDKIFGAGTCNWDSDRLTDLGVHKFEERAPLHYDSNFNRFEYLLDDGSERYSYDSSKGCYYQEWDYTRRDSGQALQLAFEYLGEELDRRWDLIQTWENSGTRNTYFADFRRDMRAFLKRSDFPLGVAKKLDRITHRENTIKGYFDGINIDGTSSLDSKIMDYFGAQDSSETSYDALPESRVDRETYLYHEWPRIPGIHYSLFPIAARGIDPKGDVTGIDSYGAQTVDSAGIGLPWSGGQSISLEMDSYIVGGFDMDWRMTDSLSGLSIDNVTGTLSGTVDSATSGDSGQMTIWAYERDTEYFARFKLTYVVS